MTERKRFDAVGTVGGRLTDTRVEVCEVWVEWDFFDAGEDFASSWVVLAIFFPEMGFGGEKGKLTRVVKAVLPAPLGPKRRKLLDGGDATLRKKMICRRTGTPKVKRIATAMALRLPSKRNVRMPVSEFQLAWLDMVWADLIWTGKESSLR